MSGFPVDEDGQLNASAFIFEIRASQCQSEQASRKVKGVLAGLDPCGIPIDPDGAARPRARPLFAVVGTPNLLGILAEKVNPSLHIQHVRLS